jgi:glycosyltransferase involved in cell wall biosynthesis
MNKITIFIPAYNSETTIKDTLNSIEKQTTNDIGEIIIFDDGSKDNTLSIIKTFADKSRFKYRLIQNDRPTGLASKYNRALELSNFEFLLIVHPDVLIEDDDAIEKYFKVMQDSNVVAAMCQIKHLFNDYFNYSFWKKCEFDRLVNQRKWLLAGKFDIYRVSVLKKLGGFNSVNYHKAGEDSDMHFRLKKYGEIRRVESSYIHKHSFRNDYKLATLFHRHALYSEAFGVVFRNHYKEFGVIQFFITFFREIMSLSLMLGILIELFCGVIFPLLGVIIIFLVYSFLYTKNTFIYSNKNPRVLLLPFVNILLIFISNFFVLKGFITNKQKL